MHTSKNLKISYGSCTRAPGKSQGDPGGQQEGGGERPATETGKGRRSCDRKRQGSVEHPGLAEAELGDHPAIGIDEGRDPSPIAQGNAHRAWALAKCW